MRTPSVTSIAVMLWISFTGCQTHNPYFVPLAADDSQDSTIYFYRPYSGILNSPAYEVTESGAHVGMLSEGGYFVLGTRPGVHLYGVRKGVGGVSLYAESGKRYFVKLVWTKKREGSGLAAQHVVLELAQEHDAVRELRKYQPNALAEP